MKILLTLLMSLAVVTTLAQEGYKYRVEIHGNFVALERQLFDRWQKDNPSQIIDLAAFSRLCSKSKTTVLFFRIFSWCLAENLSSTHEYVTADPVIFVFFTI